MLLGPKVLEQAAEVLAPYRRSRLLVVADRHVGPHYAAPLVERLAAAGFAAAQIDLPAGEEAKTGAALEAIYRAFLALEVERRDVVIALGGGATGDVAGFAAGTYLRGLTLVQAPTTLIAMMTASVGGKVGINFEGHKNQIGMFKQPELILADLTTLDTLPDIELRSGLGELITVGVLGAPAIFEALEGGQIDLAEQIAAAVQCKSALVDADPFDLLGLRAKLNLGHTFGHALEQLSGFRLPHGIAVGVGLHLACRLAGLLELCPPGLADRVAATLRRHGLPDRLTGYTPAAVLEAMRRDKKRSGGRLRLVLPVALGQVEIVDEERIVPALLLQALREIVPERQV